MINPKKPETNSFPIFTNREQVGDLIAAIEKFGVKIVLSDLAAKKPNPETEQPLPTDTDPNSSSTEIP